MQSFVLNKSLEGLHNEEDTKKFLREALLDFDRRVDEKFAQKMAPFVQAHELAITGLKAHQEILSNGWQKMTNEFSGMQRSLDVWAQNEQKMRTKKIAEVQAHMDTQVAKIRLEVQNSAQKFLQATSALAHDIKEIREMMATNAFQKNVQGADLSFQNVQLKRQLDEMRLQLNQVAHEKANMNAVLEKKLDELQEKVVAQTKSLPTPIVAPPLHNPRLFQLDPESVENVPEIVGNSDAFWDFVDTDNDFGDLQTADGTFLQIRPVGVISGPENSAAMQGGNVFQQMLAKNAVLPKFTNDKKDWDDFVWNFDAFCRKVDGGKPLADKTKLLFLEMAFPTALQNEIKLWQKQSNHQLTFVEAMQRYEKRFGEGRSIGKRTKWREVTLENFGKVDSTQLRDFETRFCLSQLDVKDATPLEAYQLLMERLPSFMRTWVIEEENRIASNHPRLCIKALDGMTAVDVLDNVQRLIGERPKSGIPTKDGSFVVELSSILLANELLKFNGRTITGTTKKFVVKQVEQTLNTEKIFRLCESKLLIREKAEALSRSGDMGGVAHQSRLQKREEKKEKRRGTSCNEPPHAFAHASSVVAATAVLSANSHPKPKNKGEVNPPPGHVPPTPPSPSTPKSGGGGGGSWRDMAPQSQPQVQSWRGKSPQNQDTKGNGGGWSQKGNSFGQKGGNFGRGRGNFGSSWQNDSWQWNSQKGKGSKGNLNGNATNWNSHGFAATEKNFVAAQNSYENPNWSAGNNNFAQNNAKGKGKNGKSGDNGKGKGFGGRGGSAPPTIV